MWGTAVARSLMKEERKLIPGIRLVSQIVKDEKISRPKALVEARGIRGVVEVWASINEVEVIEDNRKEKKWKV
jgi:hypothetical protein